MEKRSKITLSAPAALTMPLHDAERLTDAANAFDALLYIYLLQCGGELDAPQAARALRVSEPTVLESAGRLAALGILSGTPQRREVLEPAQELPEVSAEDIARRTADSDDFKALVAETQHIYGRLLSTSELKTLFGLYDYLALPPEVIMLLIHHCAEQTERRYGPGKKPTFRTLEKEAYAWANREIITYERAEQYIAETQRRGEKLTQAADALGIRDRTLTTTERRYLESWLDMGFDPAAIAEAMERTVTNTGGVKWRYMDGIVRSWDSKGLHTLAEIAAGDKKSARGAPEAAQGPTAEEFERMKKLREKVRNS